MNLYTRLANLALQQPDKTAIEGANASLTYAEFDYKVRCISGALRGAGVGQGDTVAVRMRETRDHIAAMFAIMRIGATILPLDWRGTRNEFERVARRHPPRVFVSDDTPSKDWFQSVVDCATVGDDKPDAEPPADVVDAPLIYSLTSGTTGEPKLMVVTHEQLLARCLNRAVQSMFLPTDRFLNTLALAFTAGREHALSAVLIGATLSLYPLLFDAKELIAFVNSNAITGMNLSPNMSRSLLSLASTGERLMPGLRVMISTTGKLQPEERAAIRTRVSPNLIDYYGATAVGLIAVLTGETDDGDPSSVGRPVLGVEVGIADDDGNALPAGEVGRIRVRGPAVALPGPGTIADADEGFRGGWFYPGDLGYLSPEGMLRLHGRAADLIKRGGLMVHAQEVEQALRRHPAIADAAVVGAPSAELGQEVVAFVVVSGPVEAKELTRHCRGEVAPFKVPARFIVVENLPRNANGKVVKAELLKTL